MNQKSDDDPSIQRAKEIMKRLAHTPPEPHKDIPKKRRASKAEPSPQGKIAREPS